jgi:hypothetical protein
MWLVEISLHVKQHIVKWDGTEVLKDRQYPSIMTSHWLFKKAEVFHILYPQKINTRVYHSSSFSEPNQLMSITAYHAILPTKYQQVRMYDYDSVSFVICRRILSTMKNQLQAAMLKFSDLTLTSKC